MLLSPNVQLSVPVTVNQCPRSDGVRQPRQAPQSIGSWTRSDRHLHLDDGTGPSEAEPEMGEWLVTLALLVMEVIVVFGSWYHT